MKRIILTTLTALFITNCMAQSHDIPDITQVIKTAMSSPKLKNHNAHIFKLELSPGFSNEVQHKHTGDLFGYVLDGKVEIHMKSVGPVVYQAGEIFHEKHMELHISYKNPDTHNKAVILMIHILKKNAQGYILEH